MNINSIPLFDFHTHNIDAMPQAIININDNILVNPERYSPRPQLFYSVGLHPYTLYSNNNEELSRCVYSLAKRPEVVAIGESGVDRSCSVPIDIQCKVFEQMILFSEELGKPLTIHCVRAFDILLQLHKKLQPKQIWTIHGFRGKPALASQLLNIGFHLSFGEYFNIESLRLCPLHCLNIETDESCLSIEKIRNKVLAARLEY